eukprot:6482796-Amphidinium_carterae.1
MTRLSRATPTSWFSVTVSSCSSEPRAEVVMQCTTFVLRLACASTTTTLVHCGVKLDDNVSTLSPHLSASTGQAL